MKTPSLSLTAYCRIAVLAVPALLAAGSVGCGGAEPINMDRDALSRVGRVAVLPFAGGDSAQGVRPGEAVAGGLCRAMRAEIPRLKLVERTRIGDLIKEKRGAATGEFKAEEAAEVGKFLGVEAIVTGAITQYSRVEPRYENGYLESYTVAANMRIIDVKTGRLLYAYSGNGSQQPNYTSAVEAACRAMIAPLKGVPGYAAGPLGGF
jgi:hypothetical protein